MPRQAVEPTLISSVRRALRLLEEVSNSPRGNTAKSLARRSGLALPTTYHLLRTLVHDGYLDKLEDGSYVLGDHVGEVLSASPGHLVHRKVRASLAELRDRTRAAAYLARYHDGEAEVTEIVDSPAHPRVDCPIDFREAAHATAVGKCLLSGLSRSERAEHFDRHPPLDLTPQTLTRTRELVHGARPRLCVDTEEYSLGTSCVAVPVDGWPTPVAVGVSLPAGRFDRARGVRDELVAAAERIAGALAVSGMFPEARKTPA
ncbi:helix-turn-helix domain-containing protein [Saccharopolyspora sp. HNM0983]|uniref:Helix-turn-helix domain-containing protein n=1 Tax=Saccharopolyspora montiporae TaxID=2781240 RepID=A0A929B8F4_9PSEU|nr:IclR family transcriptional regulator C-terminal domain-containing protein [Saccharopolyspora sp. HNM0983]MBE9372987.1 helix-turn-helix domain-containing protein [Saccharopolyspora sp. HNM0983]